MDCTSAALEGMLPFAMSAGILLASLCSVAHCCTIFLKSSGYRNIDDRHRNPNINIREIIWLGNQLAFSLPRVCIKWSKIVENGPKLGENVFCPFSGLGF